jgi:hypothetical protein
LDWPTTLIAAGVLLVLTVLAGWAGSRPPDLMKGPRLVPYRFLMTLGAVGLMLLLVHMLNLAGLKTGR